MRLLIFAAALAIPAFAAHGKPPAGQSIVKMPGMNSTCADPNLVHQAKPGGKAKMSKLAELPPANMYLSVLRAVDGCQVPVVAAYGIGSTDRRERPRR